MSSSWRLASFLLALDVFHVGRALGAGCWVISVTVDAFGIFHCDVFNFAFTWLMFFRAFHASPETTTAARRVVPILAVATRHWVFASIFEFLPRDDEGVKNLVLVLECVDVDAAGEVQ